MEDQEERALRNVTLPFLLAFAGFCSVSVFVMILVGSPSSDISCTQGLPNSGWCSTNGFDVAVTEALAMKSPSAKGAAMLSHVLNFAVCPVIGVGSLSYSIRPVQHRREDIAIWFSTQLVSMSVNGVAKALSLRQRPCFHFRAYNETEFAGWPLSDQQFKSFYSGDTSMAWSFVAAAAALCSARGSSRRRYTIVATKMGGIVALVGSVLRIVGFVHWATDVIVGIFFGCLLGAGLPTLLFRPRENAAGDSDARLALVGGTTASSSIGSIKVASASSKIP